MEDNLQRLIRWALPGWAAILAWVFFVSLDLALTPYRPNRYMFDASMTEFWKSLSSLAVATNNLWAAVFTATFAAAAGVPVGFFIYQIYFFMRWSSPLLFSGLIVFIPGPMRIEAYRKLKKPPEEKSSEASAPTTNCEDKNLAQINYDLLRHQFDINDDFEVPSAQNDLLREHIYRFYESLFLEACRHFDKDKPLSTRYFSRYRYLHEISHTLGASLGGVYLAFAGYTMTKLYSANILAPTIIDNINIALPFIGPIENIPIAALFAIRLSAMAIVFIAIVIALSIIFGQERKRYKLGEITTVQYPIGRWRGSQWNLTARFPVVTFLWTLISIYILWTPIFTPLSSWSWWIVSFIAKLLVSVTVYLYLLSLERRPQNSKEDSPQKDTCVAEKNISIHIMLPIFLVLMALVPPAQELLSGSQWLSDLAAITLLDPGFFACLIAFCIITMVFVYNQQNAYGEIVRKQVFVINAYTSSILTKRCEASKKTKNEEMEE